MNDQENQLKELETKLEELTADLLELRPLSGVAPSSPVASMRVAVAESARAVR